ncbi:unnamed protein product [Rotaria magnacalcarata]|uniref:Ion transport domain-containing protein n=2 Tax=Rotaria magnacalcarata TaxID=392030 RepID=A0A8S2SKS1_9BILA|nr:unnamed protein product [Rotaria magnacalcarata]
MNYNSIVFREFTQESFQRIEQYRQEETERIGFEKLQRETTQNDDINDMYHLNKSSKNEPNRAPNKELAVGQTLPRVLQHRFPPELIGIPIEEIDSYYRTEYTFVVVNRSNTIFRFSATRACFIFSPFNCFRRLAVRILTHSVFSTLVMLTILSNCIFMTLRNAPEVTEYIFTIIYTVEASTKCVARGFILQPHTFLRDPWNWLDFIVITLAYVTFFINLGKVAVLRTFRVLRALKTVAVVPGLKTIVNALIQSFIALRDVAVLSSFILSIFALVGLQLYMGVLRQKCVPTYELFLNNSKISNSRSNTSYDFYLKELDNEKCCIIFFFPQIFTANWYQQDDIYVLCGNSSGSIRCPDGHVCWKDRGISPDYGYTSFDNYGWSMLACFRLMTQDYWENLYQLVLSAAGRFHFFYFLAVIFFGSFYLINLILAIVSMSYFEQQKQIAAENEELERRKIQDELEIQNEEAEIHLHTENAPCHDELDHHISNCTVAIQYEQKEKANSSNRIRSSQTTPSIYQFNKSNLSLSNTLMDDYAALLFIDDTRPNTPNEIHKYKKTRSYSHISERNQNHDDSTVTVIVTIFVLDAFVDLFITICIVLNTVFMALDHHGQSELMTRILTGGNYFFTTVFTFECTLKLIAMAPAEFFKNGWNAFDFVIVSVSLIELGLANVKGLSVLRSFRLVSNYH